jgi:hypothetical protein
MWCFFSPCEDPLHAWKDLTLNFPSFSSLFQGILSAVQIDNLTLQRWKMLPIQLDNLRKLTNTGLPKEFSYETGERTIIWRDFKYDVGNFRYRHAGLILLVNIQLSLMLNKVAIKIKIFVLLLLLI